MIQVPNAGAFIGQAAASWGGLQLPLRQQRRRTDDSGMGDPDLVGVYGALRLAFVPRRSDTRHEFSHRLLPAKVMVGKVCRHGGKAGSGRALFDPSVDASSNLTQHARKLCPIRTHRKRILSIVLTQIKVDLLPLLPDDLSACHH